MEPRGFGFKMIVSRDVMNTVTVSGVFLDYFVEKHLKLSL